MRNSRAITRVLALSIMSCANVAMAADATPYAFCGKPVFLKCNDVSGPDKLVICSADVEFVQQGANQHLFGCELRTDRMIFDCLTVDVRLIDDRGFYVRTINFISEEGVDQSGVIVTLQRPEEEVGTTNPTGEITIKGKTERLNCNPKLQEPTD